MRSSRSSMRSSLKRSTKLGILKHASLLPLWTSTIIWMPPNTEDHLISTWVSLMRSELIIKTLINMRLLLTQMLRPEVKEVEKDIFLQKGWKPDASLQKYAGRFSHEYSRCVEADDKTAFKAFTAGLRDYFFKYMINANTWKT
ncbi:hypothetical protein EV2_047944 [Malus domestica]